MKILFIALFVIVSIASASAGGLLLLHVGSSNGNGGVVPPLTNLRITNTGAFRITNTGDNRAVSP